jgi:alkanesulfonate monooxygenase SsuD/methylene tetrahydromethanopterin reductase-like flavin-dependent oxidoreductase (luciferase family)
MKVGLIPASGGTFPTAASTVTEAVQPAARRAGRQGDGYFPFGKDPTRLRELVSVARQGAEDAGRDPDALELTCLRSRHRHIMEQRVDIGLTQMTLVLPKATQSGVATVAEQAAEVTAGL